jgi:PAS domain S-box-containing protein
MPMFCLDVLSLEPLDVVFSGLNAAQSAVTGIAPEALLGRRPYEALPPRVAANVMANYRRCIAERGLIEYEEAHETEAGERWYATTLAPWLDGTGRITAIVGSAVQVTARRERSQDDAATIARLRHLSDEVRTFSAMAAHDVRGPLATVESLSELIAAEIEDGNIEEALSLVRDCGAMALEARGQMDALLRHANALGLDAAPAEAMEETDLGRMGRDLSAVIDPRGLVAMHWPQEVVRADAVTLQLILRNLMTNAVRHCRGAVRVTFEPPLGSEGLGAFTVADDGPGFDRDPFAETSAVRRHETARGFGLAAARYLVESRGGAIALVPGAKGGAVRFTIPCRPAD